MRLYVRKLGNGMHYVRGPGSKTIPATEAESYDWFDCWIHEDGSYSKNFRKGDPPDTEVAQFALVEQDRFPLFKQGVEE